jgi:hypothetical protein
MLVATVTTPLTRLSHRTVWMGSGGSNRLPGQGVWGAAPKGRISKNLCVHSSLIPGDKGTRLEIFKIPGYLDTWNLRNLYV